jgi:hypothetical protein
MLTVRVLRSEFGPLVVKTRTYAAAANYLMLLSQTKMIMPFGDFAPGETIPVYDWIDCWFENPQPFAEITGEPGD